MANNWNHKEALAKKARQHTEEMRRKYRSEIDRCIKRTVTLNRDDAPDLKEKSGSQPEWLLSPLDTVAAVVDMECEGKTAVLNFASFKSPGGGFIRGAKAQEECLCHESFLYNVLSEQKEYYEVNNKKTNRSLYYDRALYSPDVIFEVGEKKRICDVITCAAPNWSAAKRIGVSYDDNLEALRSRIDFIAAICMRMRVRNVIVGAYGCGVFGQDPNVVREFFKEAFKKTDLKQVIFAVPTGIDPVMYHIFEMDTTLRQIDAE